MNRSLWFAVAGLVVVGCSQPDTDVTQESRTERDLIAATPSQTADLVMSGFEAYEMACASCHEPGLNGAPATRDPDVWSDRSMQWEAVLFDHATRGYMTMPGKGGQLSLSDRSVVAATEYMLSIVYPDLPPDQ